MMGVGDRFRVVGRCYLCGRPVMACDAARVTDSAVRSFNGQPVRRLAHAVTCANTLRGRIGRR